MQRWELLAQGSQELSHNRASAESISAHPSSACSLLAKATARAEPTAHLRGLTASSLSHGHRAAAAGGPYGQLCSSSKHGEEESTALCLLGCITGH